MQKTHGTSMLFFGAAVAFLLLTPNVAHAESTNSPVTYSKVEPVLESPETETSLKFNEDSGEVEEYEVSHESASTANQYLEWSSSDPDEAHFSWELPEGAEAGEWDVLIDGTHVFGPTKEQEVTLGGVSGRKIEVVGSVLDTSTGKDERIGHYLATRMPELTDVTGVKVAEARAVATQDASAAAAIKLVNARVIWDAFIPSPFIQPTGYQLCIETRGIPDPWFGGNGKYNPTTGKSTPRPFYRDNYDSLDVKTKARGIMYFDNYFNGAEEYITRTPIVPETVLYNRVKTAGQPNRFIPQKRATASTDEIKVTGKLPKADTVRIEIDHNATNPLCTGAPGITYTAAIAVNKGGAFNARGLTDKAPSHSLNIVWNEDLLNGGRKGTACLLQENVQSFAHLAPGFPRYSWAVSGNVVGYGCPPGTVDPYP